MNNNDDFPFKLVPVTRSPSPIASLTSHITMTGLPVKYHHEDVIVKFKYIKDDADLDRQLTEAGDKLVLIALLLVGVHPSDNLMKSLVAKAKKYQNPVDILVVDVAKHGEICKKYNTTEIPWFILMKNKNVLEAFHSIHARKVAVNIQKHMTSSDTEDTHTLGTFIKDGNDLHKRLTEAGNKLVVIAFMIPDDETGQRLNTDLDEIEAKDEQVEILKVDVDLCPEAQAKYNIQGVPTLVFLKNQVIIDQISGNDRNKIYGAITQYKILAAKEQENISNDGQISHEPSIGKPTKKSNIQDDD